MARKPYRPAVHVLARNVRAVWDAATDADRADGAAWYAEARYAAWDLAREAAGNDAVGREGMERAAGVIAALSPSNAWQDNLRAARTLYADPNASVHTRANVAKARAILDGAEPLDVLGGLKVRAFYLNIVGDPDVVTVDRHAVDAARGRRGAYVTHNTASPHVHAAFVEAYTRVAREVGATPAEVQATVWVAWRRIHNIYTARADAAARAAA